MRILLAEDSTLLREALTALVERLGHSVVATAHDADELRRVYGRMDAGCDRPDLIVTDVRMPPQNRDDGLAAALSIRRQSPTQPVLVLSQYIADRYARDLLTLPGGAIGYLLKDRISRVNDFARSLVTVQEGGTVIDPDVVQHLLRPRDRGPLATLTPRERDVLELMADGKSNSEIAASLVVSDASVRKHVGNIFAKLGLGPVEENRRVKAVLTYLHDSRQ
ncbi:response regulator transcription factor [Paramicrobacterium chengjingii]|uniref:Response regulator transcription factor n=1 Tax=Paramicrobacterium chengjingii TaxID=2769067 RepID=A0ABX6YII9_9MICO|nr:response regulator transcription factor [Microbacterium chengjingii]QPZ38608.1 response regulator transcription factor [Microbacterium chengjingii]